AVQFGITYAVITQSTLALVTSVIFLIFYRDKPAKPALNNSRKHGIRSKVSQILKNKKLYPVFLYGITLVALQFILVGHYMIFLQEKFSMSLYTSGLLLALVQVTGIIGRVLLAWISDKYLEADRVGPLLICSLVIVLLLPFLSFMPENAPLYLVVIVSI